MYEEITGDVSLFIVDDADVKRFQQIAGSISMFEGIPIRLPLETVNMWATALNIWLLLQEEQRNYVMDYSKMMTYSSNFYCLNLLRQEKSITVFLDVHKYSDEALFLTAYYLASETTLIVRDFLEVDEEGREVNKRNQEREFLMQRDQLDEDQMDNYFFVEQKQISNVLANSYATNIFGKYVANAIRLARQHLMHLSK